MNEKKLTRKPTLLWLTSIALVCMLAVSGFVSGEFTALFANSPAYAETEIAVPAQDPSPAIYVYQKNTNSVVGITTYTQEWNRSSGRVEESPIGQGSGVVIADGGYILTNYHVIDGGDAFKILLSSGEEVEALLAGSDSALDLAVLKAADKTNELVPVSIGKSSDLLVGSTVIAIGNPGGDVLANTVTQGVVSALERSNVYSSNTTRGVAYIQHDAAINSGNSGGGLFNYRGELVGINTLKYGGSAYSTTSYDGLGFALPIDSVYPIAQQLIENGKVVRPQMGISVVDYTDGPDEPMSNYAPASVCIMEVNPGSSAEKAGLKKYDFIYAINGKRITSFRELTGVLDLYQAGDTVQITVVRYNSVNPMQQNNNNSGYYSNPYGYFMNPFGGNYGYSSPYGYEEPATSSGSTELVVGGGYEFITVDVTLELPVESEEPVNNG